MNMKTIAFSNMTAYCFVDRHQYFGRPAVSICYPEYAPAPARGIPLARGEQTVQPVPAMQQIILKCWKNSYPLVTWCHILEDCNLTTHHLKSQNIETYLITNVSSKTECSSQGVSTSSTHSKEN
jgi:hypothetical protein